MPSPIDERRLRELTALEYAGITTSGIVVRDGTTLQLHECGPEDGPPLIVVNPIGIPILLVTRLIRRLAACYRVTCWQQRGAAASPDAMPLDGAFETLLADLEDVVHSRDARSAPMVGVCSGASLLVRAAARGLIEPDRMVLISPLVRFRENHVASQFESTVVPYMRLIARGNRALAEQLIRLSNNDPGVQETSEDLHIVKQADRANLQSVDALVAYAAAVDSFMSQDFDADIAALTGRISITSAAGDKMIAAASVRRFAALIPQASLTEFAEGGHYAIFVDDRAREEIANLLIASGTL